MTTNELVNRYVERFGSDYPRTNAEFREFCKVAVMGVDSLAIAGETVYYTRESSDTVVDKGVACDAKGNLREGYAIKAKYNDADICKLVNYIRGISRNSNIDLDAVLSSPCEKLRVLMNEVVGRNNKGGSNSLRNLSYLCDIESLDNAGNYSKDDIDFITALFSDSIKKGIVEDRWKGFHIAESDEMDSLSIMGH